MIYIRTATVQPAYNGSVNTMSFYSVLQNKELLLKLEMRTVEKIMIRSM